MRITRNIISNNLKRNHLTDIVLVLSRWNNEKRQQLWSIWHRLCFLSGLIIIVLSLSFIRARTVIILVMINSVCFSWPWSFRSALSALFSWPRNDRLSKSKTREIFVYTCLQMPSIQQASDIWAKCVYVCALMIDECLFNNREKKMQVKKEKKRKWERENERERKRERKKNIGEQEKNTKKQEGSILLTKLTTGPVVR